MTMADIYRGVGDIPADDWRALARGVDQSQAYLTYRERLEPGDPVLVVANDSTGPVAALHGSLTTPRTALFSHPWKMLSSDQFLRLSGEADADQEPARHHQRLLDELLDPAKSGEPRWEGFATRIGEAIVLRGFDTSAALLRSGLSESTKLVAMLTLLRTLQGLVREGAAGAIALPFVHPGDALLRQALAETGFCAGVLTGASVFDLSGTRSYEDFVATLPGRRRYRYRKEQLAFASAGMTSRTVMLEDHLERLADLEANNLERYGGAPDRTRLAAVRAEMAKLLGPALRVPVAEIDGSIIACGIDLVDENSYLVLAYGCDYSVAEHRKTYPQLLCYEPIRFATSNGLTQVRLGFESFEAKLQRGARLETRQTWIWLPSPSAMRSLTRLLAFLSARTRAFFGSLVDTSSARFLEGKTSDGFAGQEDGTE
jgi:hypothetical protein